ncbi:MAG: SGNH/GDSL hydrolase family protein [Pirellulales bacterium]|nr:SGNH/GDSL hydrolase family protein [Pirellulales bacterium]
MKKILPSHVVLVAFLALFAVHFGNRDSLAAEKAVAPKIEGNTAWYNPEDWGVEGRVWNDTEKYYHRFPARAKKTVRKPVWSLSTNPAGMCVFFETDSDRIDVRYDLTSGVLHASHFAPTGKSGLDLYSRDKDGKWRWCGINKPGSKAETKTMIKDIPRKMREFMLYLPLYNGLNSLYIGVNKDAVFKPVAPRKEKPIVFYGTSIMQGGCVARAGMSFSSILGRRLNVPIVNLGFSGNGTMDASVGDLMAEIDAAVYVIDCLPNMDDKAVAAKTEPLVRQLRKARPDTPIVLVEDRTYDNSWIKPSSMQHNLSSRKALKAAYDRLVAAGVKGLVYVKGDGLLGDDSEATVDSSHPTDLGMMRMADSMEPVLRPLLKTQK